MSLKHHRPVSCDDGNAVASECTCLGDSECRSEVGSLTGETGASNPSNVSNVHSSQKILAKWSKLCRIFSLH